MAMADSDTKHRESIENFKNKIDNLVPKLQKEY
jgi:hypothetical protein